MKHYIFPYFQRQQPIGQRSFRYRAVGLWNSLDNELKKLPLETFKIKLEEFLLNRYYET
jgi:hypothetical protein